MAISVTTSAFERDLLEAVNRILTGAGEVSISTVDNAVGTVQKAVHAVNDAVDDIWTRCAWDFRKKFMTIALVENQFWYALPDDFHEMDTDFAVSDGTRSISYKPYAELIKIYPWLRQYPNTADMALTTVIAQTGMGDAQGEALWYTLHNEYLGYFRAPDEDYVDAQTELITSYHSMSGRMSADGDLIPLPKDLWTPHYYLSLAMLKQHLESPDYQADEGRAERLISRAILRRSKRGKITGRFVPIHQLP